MRLWYTSRLLFAVVCFLFLSAGSTVTLGEPDDPIYVGGGGCNACVGHYDQEGIYLDDDDSALDIEVDGIEGNSSADCGDGVDNDEDGWIDCWDDDCWQSDYCEELANDAVEGNFPGECSNDEDEDADGFIDCEDDDCWDSQECE